MPFKAYIIRKKTFVNCFLIFLFPVIYYPDFSPLIASGIKTGLPVTFKNENPKYREQVIPIGNREPYGRALGKTELERQSPMALSFLYAKLFFLYHPSEWIWRNTKSCWSTRSNLKRVSKSTFLPSTPISLHPAQNFLGKLSKKPNKSSLLI